jgi:hypothetical protein
MMAAEVKEAALAFAAVFHSVMPSSSQARVPRNRDPRDWVWRQPSGRAGVSSRSRDWAKAPGR